MKRRDPYSCFALLCLLLSQIKLASAAGETCSSASQCPESSPCCGVGGTCGSGSLQCAGGCQPLASYHPTSCLPNPICQNRNLTISSSDWNNAHMFWPVLLYDGDASKAPFTLDYGYLGKGPEGVLLELTAATQTKISTTDYMLYGNVEVTARHDALAGLVFAFITMSDTKDEIDWEFTTSNPQDLQTNYFSQGVTASGSAANATAPSNSFSVNDWHTYGLNWQYNSLQWLIDGKVVRSVQRSKAGENYPRSPSRVQLSMWAGGNSTNTQGVIDWAGGPIDWTSATYESQGYYSAEIKSFTMTCASQNADSSVTTIGTGDNVTSWVYTGENSTSIDEPGFSLSKDEIVFLKDPSADGTPNLPGAADQSEFTTSNKNAWDGSGNTSGLSSKETKESGSSNGQSSSGGWLNNNRALSIAVPVIAGLVALAGIWAIIVWCCRRRRKEYNNELGHGVISKSGVPSKISTPETAETYASTKPKSKIRRSTRYEQLKGSDEDLLDGAPMGARRIGQGYGPAPGTSPGPMTHDRFNDSSSSIVEQREISKAIERGFPKQEQKDTSNVYSPYAQAYAMVDRITSPRQQGTPFMETPRMGVRGPYTPAMNTYTPAIHQTPAMRQHNGTFVPSQSPGPLPYSTPQFVAQSQRHDHRWRDYQSPYTGEGHHQYGRS